jgi:hypothetical protein
MKGSCVLFLLNLKDKDVHLILAQILKASLAQYQAFFPVKNTLNNTAVPPLVLNKR